MILKLDDLSNDVLFFLKNTIFILVYYAIIVYTMSIMVYDEIFILYGIFTGF